MKYVRSLRVFSAVCFLSLFLLSSSSTWAQFRAGLQGVVSDSTGAVLPDVKVTLTSHESSLAREATTDASGTYTFNGLGPGGYTVSAEKSGFKKVVLDNVVVTAEKMQALDIQPEIGEVSQSVTVTAGTPVIDTETGQVTGTITSTRVQALPSFGRDPFQLLSLAPGVFGDNSRAAGGIGSNPLPGNAGPGGSNGTSSIFQTENQVQVSANGTRNISNSFQIDGVEVNSLAWGGAAVITPNEESVNEHGFEWQKPVREALLELDTERLKQKVANAEAAIFERLQVLSRDNGTTEERQALQDATNSLRVVKREVLKFPDWQVG